jgi:sigma-B regulation protein RsbU (phosphoserine phosphatase)
MIEKVIEKERMEEELSIARELQASMLPTKCPQIKWFEIAAVSLSAREVGGDFYDFIDMGDKRVGLLIGDVTGKGVSGALVMSASMSIFRMLSEENLSIDSIMKQANRRTEKDIKTGMFVALLYAVLNADDKTLRLCSAGQTQPIHLSSKTGKASLIETIGDTFPLGLLEDVDYQETKIDLHPGDKIIFYTDGIVEAMNHKQELFGFERLIDEVQNSGFIPTESILKNIVNRANDFEECLAQHDDLTIIVVSVEE